jgi:hypothetical protein
LRNRATKRVFIDMAKQAKKLVVIFFFIIRKERERVLEI